MAARRRVWLISPASPPCAGQRNRWPRSKRGFSAHPNNQGPLVGPYSNIDYHRCARVLWKAPLPRIRPPPSERKPRRDVNGRAGAPERRCAPSPAIRQLPLSAIAPDGRDRSGSSYPYERIARAKPNCLIMERDCLIHVPAEELAPAKRGNCLYPVAVGSNRNFVLLGSLLRSALCTQDLALCKMCEWAPRRYR